MSTSPDEFVYGAEAIAKVIGRTTSGTFWLLKYGQDQIPGARKVGGRWALHLPTYRAAFAFDPTRVAA
jgi:hypothetical protein